jgi:pimeloyl-ACP methyl ester carboxylesterase
MKALLAFVMAATPVMAGAAETDFVLPAVPLRAGAETPTADIHVKAYRSDAESCQGHVVLGVHGVAHNAASWEGFARAVLARGLAGETVCTFVTFDMPGHGSSGLPVPKPKFGNLQIAHLATALENVLLRLPAAGLAPDILIGHSQGGLLVQIAQDHATARGLSLAFLGITRVVLLTSVPPREVPWEFADSGEAFRVLSRYVRFSRPLGFHVFVPDARWPLVFFQDPAGAVVGAPSPADIARFNAREPLRSSLQLIGFLYPRPSVSSHIFGPLARVRLTVIALDNDSLIRPNEQALLYEHLTGLSGGPDFITVRATTAVHDMHVADPNGLLDALAP